MPLFAACGVVFAGAIGLVAAGACAPEPAALLSFNLAVLLAALRPPRRPEVRTEPSTVDPGTPPR